MKRFGSICTLLLMVAALSGCDGVIPARTQIWIDQPLDGEEMDAGIIPVRSRAASGNGIARVELWVNGALYRSDDNPTPDERIIHIVQPWIPTTPGNYALEVRAYAADGAVSDPASVTVRVIGELVEATETPTVEFLTPTSTFAPPTGTPALATDTPVPATDTPIPPTNTPQFQINFWADSTTLKAGDCITIHWETANVQAVYFDGRGVVGVDTYQICPCSSESHTLDVLLPDGEHDIRTLDISVTGSCPPPTPTTSPDATGPTISDTVASADVILWARGPHAGRCRYTSSCFWLIGRLRREADLPGRGSWNTTSRLTIPTIIIPGSLGFRRIEIWESPTRWGCGVMAPNEHLSCTAKYRVRDSGTFTLRTPKDPHSESDIGTVEIGYCAH